MTRPWIDPRSPEPLSNTLPSRIMGWSNTTMRNRSKRVRTPVALLRSLSGKYPWERYEPHYPPSYGLNSTTTSVDMPLNKETKKKNNQILLLLLIIIIIIMIIIIIIISPVLVSITFLGADLRDRRTFCKKKKNRKQEYSNPPLSTGSLYTIQLTVNTPAKYICNSCLIK